MRLQHCIVLSCALLASCGAGRLAEGIKGSFTTESSLAEKSAEAHETVVEVSGLYDAPRLVAYVRAVGERVARTAGFAPGEVRFYVVDDAEVNAFAIPGGLVYVNRGLLAQLTSEDELAFVLGHELAHLKAKHASKKQKARGGSNVLAALGQMGGTVLGYIMLNPALMYGSLYGGVYGSDTLVDIAASGYGRELEFSADEMALGYAVQAGYEPQGGVRTIRHFQTSASYRNVLLKQRGLKLPPPHGIFDSHPDNEARLRATQSQSAQQGPAQRRATVGNYSEQLQGLVIGTDEGVGIQRNRQFYSALHGKVLTLPAGWFAAQSYKAELVSLVAPDDSARVVLKKVPLKAAIPPAELALLIIPGTAQQGRLLRQDGQEAWRGRIVREQTRTEVLAWCEPSAEDPHGLVLVGVDGEKPGAKRLDATQWKTLFDGVASSLRTLRGDEMPLTQALKLRIKEASAGESYRQLAASGPLGADGEMQLRVLNGQYPTGEPVKGQRLKLVQ